MITKKTSESSDVVSGLVWWGWMESNHLPSGYEPPALTDELQPRTPIL